MPGHNSPPSPTPQEFPPGLVSIIIPTYNAAPFLTTAISSALAQTHAAIEVIVIDDGSTDATPALITQMASADPRIIPITLPRNRGVSAARNAGFACARGEWVALLDADDQFLPTRIASLLTEATRHSADLIADNLQMRDLATGAALGLAFPAIWMAGPATARFILERDIAGLYRREIAYIKPLIRRRLLTRHNISYNEDIPAGEDLLFYLDCLRAGAQLHLVPDAFYIYSLRAGSLTSTGAANLGCLRANAILQNLDGGEDPAISALLVLREASINFELLIWHLRLRRPRASLAAACRIPPAFLAAKILRAVSRRLGVPAANPAAAALARIAAQHPG